MTADTLTAIIVMLGTSTVFLSIGVAIKFQKLRNRVTGKTCILSAAIYYNLLGEFVIGLGTLVFAVLAYSGKLPFISIEIQSLMRLTMFAATALTTAHLFLTIRDIEK
jgi:hypothetical protein